MDLICLPVHLNLPAASYLKLCYITVAVNCFKSEMKKEKKKFTVCIFVYVDIKTGKNKKKQVQGTL